MPMQESSLETLLGAAIEIEDQSQRDAYLQRVCAGNAPRLAELQSMVHDYFAAGSLIDRPAVVIATVDYPRLHIDQRIGPYKLLEQIGEGGMGTVYMAEQKEPVRRMVALKVIKPGMDTRQVVARFEAERQALAMMNHPNIAKVLDAGATETGRPYFVMELVKGTALTEFCDGQKLENRRRLELFITLCQAVGHAHQKGLIHRDLKPSNVLVEMHDVRPVPKVIDFGVSKAIGQQLTTHTLHTGFSEMIGTPLYMSPEQAGQSSIDVDTRSDIYSLGVLLYELLTGTTPFDKDILTKAGYDEMRRMIREDEPPHPSARISTLQAQALSTVSSRRQVEPRKLSNQLRGELDWIVMKALEKDRTRRYESAIAMAADVQRYLDDEPVGACPPSILYRLRKLGRRNKTMLTTGCVVAVVLIAGTAVSTWQAMEATSARKLADERLILADERRILADTRLTNEKEARTDAVEHRKHASGNLQRALDLIDRMLTRLGYDQYGFANYIKLIETDVKTGVRVGNESDENAFNLFLRTDVQPRTRVATQNNQNDSQIEQVRERILDDFLAFYRGFVKYKSDDPAVSFQMACTHLRIGTIYGSLGRPKERDEAFLDARDVLEELHAQNPRQADFTMELASVNNFIGSAQPDAKEAEQYHRRAVALLEPLVAQQPDLLDSKGQGVCGHLALTFHFIGNLSTHQGRYQEGEADLRRAIALCQNKTGRSRDVLAACYTSLANVLDKDDRLTEALEAQRKGIEIRKAVVAASPRSAFFRQCLTADFNLYANLLIKAGRSKEAEDAYREALDLWKDIAEVFRHSAVNDLRTSLIGLLLKTGRGEDAEKIIAEFPARTPEDLLARGQAYHTTGDLENALADFDLAIELAADNASCRASLNSRYSLLGERLQELGKFGEAESVYRKAIAISNKLTAESPEESYYWAQYTHSHVRLAKLLQATGRIKEAEADFSAVIAAAKTDDDLIGAYQLRIDLYQHSGLFDETQRDLILQVALLEKTLKNSRGTSGANESRTRQILYMLSKDYFLSGNLDKALPTSEECFTLHRESLGLGHPHTLSCMQTLCDIYRVTGRLNKALLIFRESVKTWEGKLAPEDPKLLDLYNNWAVLQNEGGQFAEAIPVLERVRAGRIAKLGSDHPDSLNAINNLGVAYFSAGKLEMALPLMEGAVLGQRKTLGSTHPSTLNSIRSLAGCYERLRKFDLAEPLWRERLSAVKMASGADSPPYASELANLGLILLGQAKFIEAEVIMRECLAIREAKLPDDWTTSNAKSILGAALLGQNKFDAAEKLLVTGYGGLKQGEDKIPFEAKYRITEAKQRLFELYTQWDRPAEADKWRALLPPATRSDSGPPSVPVPKKE